MIVECKPEKSGTASPAIDLAAIHKAGRRFAESITEVSRHGQRGDKTDRRLAERILARAFSAPEEPRRVLRDSTRLVHTAAKQAGEFAAGLRRFVGARGPSGESPRILLIARAYLDQVQFHFMEESCAAFLNGVQEITALEMGEIWALKPCLELVILQHLETTGYQSWAALVTSLRQVGETAWKDLFESVSLVDRVLSTDPANAYLRMDFESRDLYRSVIARLAKRSSYSEREVAEAAVDLARQVLPHDRSRFALRRSHVGYYLIDGGLGQLKDRIGYRPPLTGMPKELALRFPAVFYLAGIEVLTLVTVAILNSGADHLTPILFGLLLLLLPATQTAVDFMNHLVTYLVPPRPLPKLDFSEGVPAECATMVAVPSLLLSEPTLRDLILDLEIRFLANRGQNLYFALVTDVPDSDRPHDEHDKLVAVCRELIEGLNRRYPESPFFLFHRNRVYNDSESRWMGWERKRGKLLDLNRLIRGGFDAFPVKVGRLEVLSGIRYVITLDSDTQLPRDSAAKLIGAIAHPLNAAVVDPESQIVTEGYGILQPRIGVSIRSASRSRLAALYSGETGFDIYTRAVSDVYQDLFAEGSFTGKGIYEVDVMCTVLERRFPENALLSHDLIEGAYARVALVSDIELIDDYPSHFSAYNRRKHRWVRGDWQILRWLFNRVPDYQRQPVPNPISLISRWKIFDNLRRSLIDPSVLLLMLGGWFVLPGVPGYWTALAIAVLLLPVYCDLLFALLRIPRTRRAMATWIRDTSRAFANGHAIALFALVFLLHQALLSIDAISRSVLRVFVTRRKLLEWETAAEAEAAAGSKATVDRYLEWTSGIGILLALVVWLLRPAALPAAAPVLALWIGSRAFSAWLNRAPRTMNRALNLEDREWLRAHAERICRYFQDWSSASTNWLIPDSVREDGAVALRLSPTNLGMLLNARIAALRFGVINLGEFISQTRKTLDRTVALSKHRGHLFNWYDIDTLQPLEPLFVSTVDSGNLAAALWTLKQAALALAAEPRAKYDLTIEMAAELNEIADIADTLVRDMDFRFLYHRRKKVLSVGYEVAAGRLEPSFYDLLASEARIAVFVAIAKGDIPNEAWFHLGRAHALARGERILLSWTGTMFEYLMPALWIRHYDDTLLDQSIRAVVRVQQQHCARKGVPWGISECAHTGNGTGEPGYAAFGIAALSLKRQESNSLVIAPYASQLALTVDPAAAIKNLRQMEEYGWSGRYGFYEAAEYTGQGAEVVHAWMAHHEGMALLAICNLLFDNPMRQYFHAEPQVMATELLLTERLPHSVAAEDELEPEVPLAIPVPA
uniref:Glycosyltransferase 36 n=1 Tax=Solibacter usitatus (strain Ellin6076) TaxID=234267 RepID=Q01R72_SOLUE